MTRSAQVFLAALAAVAVVSLIAIIAMTLPARGQDVEFPSGAEPTPTPAPAVAIWRPRHLVVDFVDRQVEVIIEGYDANGQRIAPTQERVIYVEGEQGQLVLDALAARGINWGALVRAVVQSIDVVQGRPTRGAVLVTPTPTPTATPTVP